MRLKCLLWTIVLLVAFRTSPAWAEPPLTPLLVWGTLGSGLNNLDHPFAVEPGPDGYLYVADQHNNRIVVFTNTGTVVRSWNVPGPVDVSHPSGLAITPDGIVYVSEHQGHRISKWTTSGTFLGFVALQGSGAGQVLYPVHLALDGGGSLYVADYGNARVDKFDSSDNFLGFIGVGDLTGPYGVDVDAGYIYVGGYLQDIIRKYDLTGAPVDTWSGDLSGVEGIAHDAVGDIYVCDTGNHRIKKFSPAGALLATFGSFGTELGEMYTPSDVAVDHAGDVYSCEWGNARIQRWTLAPVSTRLSSWGYLKASYR